MIESAREFVRLRTSEIPSEYNRAASEPATLDVWLDVIRDYPEMTSWVVHNKTVPLEVLALMAQSRDPRLRRDVAMKRKLSPSLFALLGADEDETVRATIARNRRCPADVLARMRTDSCPLVSAAACRAGDA